MRACGFVELFVWFWLDMGIGLSFQTEVQIRIVNCQNNMEHSAAWNGNCWYHINNNNNAERINGPRKCNLFFVRRYFFHPKIRTWYIIHTNYVYIRCPITNISLGLGRWPKNEIQSAPPSTNPKASLIRALWALSGVCLRALIEWKFRTKYSCLFWVSLFVCVPTCA